MNFLLDFSWFGFLLLLLLLCGSLTFLGRHLRKEGSDCAVIRFLFIDFRWTITYRRLIFDTLGGRLK